MGQRIDKRVPIPVIVRRRYRSLPCRFGARYGRSLWLMTRAATMNWYFPPTQIQRRGGAD
jgi:hypothetical protein